MDCPMIMIPIKSIKPYKATYRTTIDGFSWDACQVWGVAKDLFEGDSGTSELQPNATVPADVGSETW